VQHTHKQLCLSSNLIDLPFAQKGLFSNSVGTPVTTPSPSLATQKPDALHAHRKQTNARSVMCNGAALCQPNNHHAKQRPLWPCVSMQQHHSRNKLLGFSAQQFTQQHSVSDTALQQQLAASTKQHPAATHTCTGCAWFAQLCSTHQQANSQISTWALALDTNQ
jgi:hypothetical protein